MDRQPQSEDSSKSLKSDDKSLKLFCPDNGEDSDDPPDMISVWFSPSFRYKPTNVPRYSQSQHEKHYQQKKFSIYPMLFPTTS
jgi:hypothetical protein